MPLAPITHSQALIGAAYAPSLNAAFTELEAAFGFWPVVLLPYGASRTPAQEQAANPGGPRNSDHVLQRAVDINNQHAFRAVNNARFVAILAKHGWHCVTVNGADFTKVEPWHFANRSSTPASEGSTSLDNTTTKGNTMSLHVIADPTLPNQPAPGGPYNPAHPELTGGNYGLLNDSTGRYVQIIGSQKQIEMLEAFIAAPAGTTYVPVATPPQTVAQNAAWLKALIASVGTTAVPIDVAAFAKTLAPLLDTVTEAELVAALATIKFPTKGTVELA